jgi:hypothetical protein
VGKNMAQEIVVGFHLILVDFIGFLSDFMLHFFPIYWN